MLWRATQGVVDGRMTLGDLVMVNAFMIQLYIPLNFLGVIYREIKQSLTDLDKMFTLMDRSARWPMPPARSRCRGWRQPTVRFETCTLPTTRRGPSCNGVSFEIPAGKTVAVVGPRARASPRWRGCCSASTTSSRAASPSPGRTSAA
jgi:ABC-type transport system involved in Fe-S cluster assembly fused permease/ATPase subunit